MNAGPESIRVVLADDHVLVRGGIRALLEQMPDVEVVGEAGDGRQALELVRVLQPSLILMDIGMRGLNGLLATAQIARDFPATRVLILSMHCAEDYVIQALHAGASGYLLKRSATDELPQAVRAVARGERYLCPAISNRVARMCLQHVHGRRTGLESLPPRQREVLQLVAEGKSNKEIAHLLRISVKTVGTHRDHLMKALDIHEVTGLVRYAIRSGLVSAEE